MFAPGASFSRVEDLQAAELQHEDAHEQQREQRAAGALPDQAPRDRTTAEVLHEPVDAHEPDDPQELELREGQGRQQVGPPEATEEVAAAGGSRDEPIEEVDEEDSAQEPVHDREDVLDARVVGDVDEHQVDQREHRQDGDEDLVPGILQLTARSVGHVRSVAHGRRRRRARQRAVWLQRWRRRDRGRVRHRPQAARSRRPPRLIARRLFQWPRTVKCDPAVGFSPVPRRRIRRRRHRAR